MMSDSFLLLVFASTEANFGGNSLLAARGRVQVRGAKGEGEAAEKLGVTRNTSLRGEKHEIPEAPDVSGSARAHARVPQ